MSAPNSCGWNAASDQPWVTIGGGGNGSGNGTVNFTVAANTSGARDASVTVGGQVFTIMQTAAAVVCSYSINPTSQAIGAAAVTGQSIVVSAAAGCNWTAQRNANWITISSGGSGSGNGTVQFSAQANSGNARTGTLTIASQTFTLTQAAPCSFSINPNNRDFTEDGGTAPSQSRRPPAASGRRRATTPGSPSCPARAAPAMEPCPTASRRTMAGNEEGR